ncbi:hypothetical protein ACE1CI_13710 [Aerosakkonemataceae cyanobacterium BLCC-F50]|uniref:Uncharacterized protein n=1 Tax=Floridaenema flaviceps BLCC-F50 TaxID=3153642 RepID=A0ABV4XQJ6_9CYAN
MDWYDLEKLGANLCPGAMLINESARSHATDTLLHSSHIFKL